MGNKCNAPNGWHQYASEMFACNTCGVQKYITDLGEHDMGNKTLNPSHEIDGRLIFAEGMMLTAVAISGLATCRRRAIGCVLVKDRHIVSTGYNGSPKGMRHCLEAGCMLHDGHCIRCVHAEANACLRCESADFAYCTDRPCLTCLRLMIQKGVKQVIYWRHYTDPETDRFIEESYGRHNSPLSMVNPRFDSLLSAMDSGLRGHIQQSKGCDIDAFR